MSTDQLRRRAASQGLKITKRQGGFMVIDPHTNTAIAGSHPPYSMTATDVDHYLSEED